MSIYVRLRVVAALIGRRVVNAALLASFRRHARKTRQNWSEMAADVHPLMKHADDENCLGRFPIDDEVRFVCKRQISALDPIDLPSASLAQREPFAKIPYPKRIFFGRL
ncbi:hypothetical protein ABCW43_15365 [Neorhizobium sp. IRAMC:178]|uniref:hypothetical protein n=1 Tax=Neorhizobium tunisiense TaxID=3144793 RepID=UPI0031F6807B